MASSIGFLLSLFFAVQVVAYVGDLTNIQVLYSNLENVAITASQMISLDGDMSERVMSYIKKNDAYVITLFGGYPAVGELFSFQLGMDYKPIIMSSSMMTLTVTRSIVIGYVN